MTGLTNKVCVVCKETFVPTRFHSGNQKYCGKRCRDKAANQRNSEYKRRWANKNKNRVRASQQRWLQTYPERRQKASETYRKNNKRYYASKASEYSAKKKNAVPEWEDQELIDLIYEECPDGCEVDHIVPLNGKTVCGLHTRTNLQYLPISLNRRKSNKLDEDISAVLKVGAFSDDRHDQ